MGMVPSATDGAPHVLQMGCGYDMGLPAFGPILKKRFLRISGYE